MTISYDSEGDIRYIDLEPSRADEDTPECAPGVVVRSERGTGAVLGFEVQRLSRRASCEDGLRLPIAAEFIVRR